MWFWYGVPMLVSNPSSVVTQSHGHFAENIVCTHEDLVKQQDI